MTITADYVIDTFNLEAKALDTEIRRHPLLGRFMAQDFSGIDTDTLREAYLGFLRHTRDYVKHTVPMLLTAGEALSMGNESDQMWGKAVLAYATEEQEKTEAGSYGHEVWAANDMRALEAPENYISGEPGLHSKLYGRFFVEEGRDSPHRWHGAKGVLEHLSITNADDFEAGLLASGIPNIGDALTFIKSHGILDIDHVRESNERLRANLTSPESLYQALQGAAFTALTYRRVLAEIR